MDKADPQRLLLVEDDRMLGDAVRDGLLQAGYEVDWVYDARSARAFLLDTAYACIVLDLGLPGQSGLQFLAKLRAEGDETPVVIATARDQVGDRVAGLNAGADDYVVKPFDLDELEARLRAVIRRSRGAVTSVLQCDGIEIDTAKLQVRKGGAPVHVGPQEYRVLLHLMQHKGTVVSKRDLERGVYGTASEVESNAVEVYVHQLRRKLGEGAIKTVRGFGYLMGGTET